LFSFVDNPVNKALSIIVNMKPLTIAERQKIIALSKEYGHQWSKIAKALDGRTSLQVKDFWHNSHRNQPEKMSVDYIVN